LTFPAYVYEAEPWQIHRVLYRATPAVADSQPESDLDAAFTTMVRPQAGALIVTPDPFFFQRRAQLLALAARYAVPTIYPSRDFTENGGLMSYGPNLSLELNQQAGTYTGQIHRGAKLADLLCNKALG
jgi:putative ABC transport system substrate-binding protein